MRPGGGRAARAGGRTGGRGAPSGTTQWVRLRSLGRRQPSVHSSLPPPPPRTSRPSGEPSCRHGRRGNMYVQYKQTMWPTWADGLADGRAWTRSGSQTQGLIFPLLWDDVGRHHRAPPPPPLRHAGPHRSRKKSAYTSPLASSPPSPFPPHPTLRPRSAAYIRQVVSSISCTLSPSSVAGAVSPCYPLLFRATTAASALWSCTHRARGLHTNARGEGGAGEGGAGSKRAGGTEDGQGRGTGADVWAWGGLATPTPSSFHPPCGPGRLEVTFGGGVFWGEGLAPGRRVPGWHGSPLPRGARRGVPRLGANTFGPDAQAKVGGPTARKKPTTVSLHRHLCALTCTHRSVVGVSRHSNGRAASLSLARPLGAPRSTAQRRRPTASRGGTGRDGAPPPLPPTPPPLSSPPLGVGCPRKRTSLPIPLFSQREPRGPVVVPTLPQWPPPQRPATPCGSPAAGCKRAAVCAGAAATPAHPCILPGRQQKWAAPVRATQAAPREVDDSFIATPPPPPTCYPAPTHPPTQK